MKTAIILTFLTVLFSARGLKNTKTKVEKQSHNFVPEENSDPTFENKGQTSEIENFDLDFDIVIDLENRGVEEPSDNVIEGDRKEDSSYPDVGLRASFVGSKCPTGRVRFGTMCVIID